jgi:twitching motility protein PilJ
VRIVLQSDRVILYRFKPDWRSGTVVAESVAHGWVKAMGQTIYDPLVPGSIERYRSGQIWTCNNVNDAVLSDCHCEILKRLQVKANMVAPVLQNGELVALLCVHQCSSPRNWQDEEIDILRQLAAQISFALNQAHLLEQLERSREDAEEARTQAELVSQQVEQARQKAEWISEEQRQQKETLQRQVVELLGDIEDSARGNLTVRARVTESTIGTVADFFNAIIENLREIVTQVQLASSQVHTSLGKDERAVSQLAEQAIEQTEEITRTLDSVEKMAHSIEGVARNANQAASVARTAATAAEAGGAAIDSTVTNILNLQTTVVKTADKVKVLGESSKQIAKVVSLVQGIALQTNLLAINAGIEASRAGEEGQGFRVVAEQIGDLATQVTNATRDIEQVIETIEQATQDVTVAMEQGRTQVVNTTRMVIDAKQSLEQIFEVSHEIDSLVQSISGATVTQAQTSGMVKQLMQEIAKTSQYTSESSRQVSSSLQQTVEVAQQLQMSVGRFKIDD